MIFKKTNQTTTLNLITKTKPTAFLTGLLVTMIMGGCSSKTLMVPEKKPKELVQLVQPTQPFLHKVWSYDAGGVNKKDPLNLQPKFMNNSFIIANREGALVRIGSTGQPLWKKNLNNAITSGVSANDKIIVVADSKGVIRTFNIENGTELWQQPLNSITLAPALVTDKRVVTYSNNGLITGLNTLTGKTEWQFKISNPDFSLRGSAKPIQLSDNYVMISSADGRIHALDIKTGIPLWVRSVSISTGKTDFDRLNDVDATPIFNDMKIYTASLTHVVGIDMLDRKELFQKPISTNKSPALASNQLLVVDKDSTVHALNSVNGQTLWKQDGLNYRKLSNPVVLNNQVLVGDYQGYLHGLDMNSGKIISRNKINSGIVSLLKISEKELIVSSDSGTYSIWQVK